MVNPARASRPTAKKKTSRPARAWVPDRGDIITIDFEPQAGREIMKRRPALVLSPKLYNAKAGMALLCPITSTIRNDSFEVRLPSGLAVSGAVLADQVRSLDWRARYARPAEKAPDEVVQDTIAKIEALLS